MTDTALIRQRETSDCGVCCLAMLTGRAYEDVIETIGDAFKPGVGLCDEHDALDRLGFDGAWDSGEPVGDYLIKHRHVFSHEFFRGLAWGRRALMTVPSLNLGPDHFHMVYWTGARVLDPSQGKTYTAWKELLPEAMVLFREAAP